MFRPSIWAVVVLSAVAVAAAKVDAPAAEPALTHAPGPLVVLYFYSPTCLKCKAVEVTVNAMEAAYGDRIRLERLSVMDPKAFERMLQLEDQYGSNESAPPKIFVGRQYLAGVKDIKAKLDAVVAEELSSWELTAAPSEPAPAQTAGAVDAAVAAAPVDDVAAAPLAYVPAFPANHASAAPAPAHVESPAAPPATDDPAAAFAAVISEMGLTPAGSVGTHAVQPAMADAAAVAPAAIPAAPIAPAPQQVALPVAAMAVMGSTAATDQPASPPGVASAAMLPMPGGSALMRKFESFRLETIAVAGLLDGINPCAFTTIVFLLSMLTYLGRSKRQLIIVGASFTLAVFLTYLCLGLGMFHAIKIFAVNGGVTTGLTLGIAAITIGLGIWSLIDMIRMRGKNGAATKGTLGLPMAVKQRMHRVIREGLKTPHLAGGAFGVGCLVSVLESLCTGQVYLPTIMLVWRTTPLRLEAMGCLVLYNLMFIVPLVIMVVVTYYGVKSDRLGAVLRNHPGSFKAAMGALFIGLGTLLLLTL